MSKKRLLGIIAACMVVVVVVVVVATRPTMVTFADANMDVVDVTCLEHCVNLTTLEPYANPI